jgi:hypothetical protein
MESSEYLIECLVKERLAEMRAEAARSALAGSLSPRRPARVALGRALVRIGRWILGPDPEHAGLVRLDGRPGS